jgi:hypothetical protein
MSSLERTFRFLLPRVRVHPTTTASAIVSLLYPDR